MIASIRSEKTEHVVMNIKKILNNPKKKKKKVLKKARGDFEEKINLSWHIIEELG